MQSGYGLLLLAGELSVVIQLLLERLVGGGEIVVAFFELLESSCYRAHELPIRVVMGRVDGVQRDTESVVHLMLPHVLETAYDLADGQLFEGSAM